MVLSLRELEIFRHVMETGSVTGAARVLRVSQPAVSKMLQQAEQRLGFALFTREGKRLRPTVEAQILFPEAVNAFAAIDVVQRLAGDLREGNSGLLTLAVIPSLANSIVPIAVQRFRAERLSVGVVMHVVSAIEVMRLVEDRRAELGIILGPVGGSDVQVIDLCTTELGCLLPTGHPLANRPELGPRDLTSVPLISAGSQWPLGALLDVAFADANVGLKISVEVPHATVAGALVRAGAGIAVLDGFGLMSAQRSELVVRAFRPRMLSVARLLRPRHRRTSRLAAEFRKTLLDVAAEHGFFFARPQRDAA
jgi:DNA-binding transcriptional LysR family regulator